MCADGKCQICAKPAVTKHHCAFHADKQREYSRNKYRAAHGIPLDAPKHSTYGGKRRAVNDSIISEPAAEYRTLNPGELIQSGDEICQNSKWETVHDCLVGWRIGVDAALIRRRRKPLVLSCDSRLPVINLQPMKLQ